MFKAQKGSKYIIKIVNCDISDINYSTISLLYEAMRILFVHKENNNNDFIHRFLLFRVSLHRHS